MIPSCKTRQSSSMVSHHPRKVAIGLFLLLVKLIVLSVTTTTDWRNGGPTNNNVGRRIVAVVEAFVVPGGLTSSSSSSSRSRIKKRKEDATIISIRRRSAKLSLQRNNNNGSGGDMNNNNNNNPYYEKRKSNHRIPDSVLFRLFAKKRDNTSNKKKEVSSSSSGGGGGGGGISSNKITSNKNTTKKKKKEVTAQVAANIESTRKELEKTKDHDDNKSTINESSNNNNKNNVGDDDNDVIVVVGDGSNIMNTKKKTKKKDTTTKSATATTKIVGSQSPFEVDNGALSTTADESSSMISSTTKNESELVADNKEEEEVAVVVEEVEPVVVSKKSSPSSSSYTERTVLGLFQMRMMMNNNQKQQQQQQQQPNQSKLKKQQQEENVSMQVSSTYTDRTAVGLLRMRLLLSMKKLKPKPQEEEVVVVVEATPTTAVVEPVLDITTGNTNDVLEEVEVEIEEAPVVTTAATTTIAPVASSSYTDRTTMGLLQMRLQQQQQQQKVQESDDVEDEVENVMKLWEQTMSEVNALEKKTEDEVSNNNDVKKENEVVASTMELLGDNAAMMLITEEADDNNKDVVTSSSSSSVTELLGDNAAAMMMPVEEETEEPSSSSVTELLGDNAAAMMMLVEEETEEPKVLNEEKGEDDGIDDASVMELLGDNAMLLMEGEEAGVMELLGDNAMLLMEVEEAHEKSEDVPNRMIGSSTVVDAGKGNVQERETVPAVVLATAEEATNDDIGTKVASATDDDVVVIAKDDAEKHLISLGLASPAVPLEHAGGAALSTVLLCSIAFGNSPLDPSTLLFASAVGYLALTEGAVGTFVSSIGSLTWGIVLTAFENMKNAGLQQKLSATIQENGKNAKGMDAATKNLDSILKNIGTTMDSWKEKLPAVVTSLQKQFNPQQGVVTKSSTKKADLPYYFLSADEQQLMMKQQQVESKKTDNVEMTTDSSKKTTLQDTLDVVEEQQLDNTAFFAPVKLQSPSFFAFETITVQQPNVPTKVPVNDEVVSKIELAADEEQNVFETASSSSSSSSYTEKTALGLLQRRLDFQRKQTKSKVTLSATTTATTTIEPLLLVTKTVDVGKPQRITRISTFSGRNDDAIEEMKAPEQLEIKILDVSKEDEEVTMLEVAVEDDENMLPKAIANAVQLKKEEEEEKVQIDEDEDDQVDMIMDLLGDNAMMMMASDEAVEQTEMALPSKKGEEKELLKDEDNQVEMIMDLLGDNAIMMVDSDYTVEEMEASVRLEEEEGNEQSEKDEDRTEMIMDLLGDNAMMMLDTDDAVMDELDAIKQGIDLAQETVDAFIEKEIIAPVEGTTVARVESKYTERTVPGLLQMRLDLQRKQLDAQKALEFTVNQQASLAENVELYKKTASIADSDEDVIALVEEETAFRPESVYTERTVPGLLQRRLGLQRKQIDAQTVSATAATENEQVSLADNDDLPEKPVFVPDSVTPQESVLVIEPVVSEQQPKRTAETKDFVVLAVEGEGKVSVEAGAVLKEGGEEGPVTIDIELPSSLYTERTALGLLEMRLNLKMSLPKQEEIKTQVEDETPVEGKGEEIKTQIEDNEPVEEIEEEIKSQTEDNEPVEEKRPIIELIRMQLEQQRLQKESPVLENDESNLINMDSAIASSEENTVWQMQMSSQELKPQGYDGENSVKTPSTAVPNEEISMEPWLDNALSQEAPVADSDSDLLGLEMLDDSMLAPDEVQLLQAKLLLLQQQRQLLQEKQQLLLERQQLMARQRKEETQVPLKADVRDAGVFGATTEEPANSLVGPTSTQLEQKQSIKDVDKFPKSQSKRNNWNTYFKESQSKNLMRKLRLPKK